VDSLADEVRYRHRQDSQGLADLRPAETPEGVQQCEAFDGICRRRGLEVGRLDRLDAGQEGGERADLSVERDEGLPITRKLLRSPSGIAPQGQAGTVGRRREGGDVRLEQAKAARIEPEVADDRGAETSYAVRADRRAHT